MGHEMGHYVLGHVTRSIWLSTFITLTGLFMVDRSGRWVIGRFRKRLGFESLADIASVPLILMLLEGAYVVLSPVAFAYSRFQEHEADRFALDLTHANHPGATSFVKMQVDNLSNPRPGRLNQFFRSTHPSIGDRIDFCNTYHPWRSDASTPPRLD
jgi:Zn-dependent protease with chaperone function